MGLPVPIARVGDINIEYYVEGAGPPLVIIQGFTLSARTWGESLLTELRSHFRLVRLSNRGTGLTDRPDAEYSISMMADDVAGLLDGLGIDRTHVMGISMCGMIAQELALGHPERVLGLVLGCTGCGAAHGVPPEPQVFAVLAATPGLTPAEWIRRVWPVAVTPEFLEKGRGVLEEVFRGDLENPTPPYVIGRHMAAIMQFDSHGRLPQIHAPALIIHGDKDQMMPVQNARILHDRIPNSKLQILPDVGHCFFWEKPNESAEAIVEILSSVPAPA